jgi:hypothetical protein
MAHFTRDGNFQIPEKAASFPSALVSWSLPGFVTHVVEGLEKRARLFVMLSDELLQHKGRRGFGYGTVGAFERGIPDDPVFVQCQVDLVFVTTERVLSRRTVGGPTDTRNGAGCDYGPG